MTREDAEKKVSASVSSLLAASRREILRMLRSGMPLSEIVESLSAFRLPKRELARLDTVLREELTRLERWQDELSADAGPSIGDALQEDAITAASSIIMPEIRSTIKRFLLKETRRAMSSGSGARGLARRLAVIEGSEEIDSRLSTLSGAMVAQYNNALTFAQAEASGTDEFLYSGPVAPSTRAFCMAHAGIIFTRAEILKMDNGQGLPVMTSCGGYNCRHEWVAITHGLSRKLSGGRRLSKSAHTLAVGKMTFVLDDKSQASLFSRHKLVRLETEKFAHTAEWYSIAQPLARLHDGLNPVVTNSPSDGVWTSRRRVDRRTGEIKTNFEHHVAKHLDEYGSRDAYRSRMRSMVEGAQVSVYRDTTGIILYRESTHDVLIVNEQGQIETMFTLKSEIFSSYFEDKKFIDSITAFL